MEKNKKIKVISFDLDDTLYEERMFVESGFRAVALYIQESYKIDAGNFFLALCDILKKEGRGKIFDHALQKYALYSPQLVAKLVDIYRGHLPLLSLREGTEEVLEDLKKKYTLALITDGIASVQRNKVRALGVEIFFDFIMYTDELGLSKPDAAIFNKTISFFGVFPYEMAYVGDNPNKDFIGAKKVGLCTVRLLQGTYKDTEVTQEYEAAYRITHVKELHDIFTEEL